MTKVVKVIDAPVKMISNHFEVGSLVQNSYGSVFVVWADHGEDCFSGIKISMGTHDGAPIGSTARLRKGGFRPFYGTLEVGEE